jgi:O-antigen ligase
MDFTSAQYTQLIIALIGSIILFVAVFRLPEKVTLSFLILLIPFQLIDSQYGTLNTMLIYLVAAAFLLQGRLSRLPFLTPVLLILFAYMISLTQTHRASYVHHVLYLIAFFGNVILFYLIYNFMLRTKDWKFIMNCLLGLNVLVIIYCTIQFLLGSQQFIVPGIDELSMNAIRGDGRLVGPFKATAATAEYFSLQAIILWYVLFNSPPRKIRNFVYVLLTANTLFLLATGNRGGFVTLILAGLVILYMFRRQLGLPKIAKMAIVSGTLLSMIALVVVNFTEYDMLFDRLESTTVEGGVPDTRADTWPHTWERIQEAPLLGHGPKLWISIDRQDLVADIPFIMYPHSLPLYILFTTGMAGMLAWITFFTQMILRLIRARNIDPTHRGMGGIPRVGLAILIVIFASQIRIEFLRMSLLDYQHYLFVLFAFLLGSADGLIANTRKEVQKQSFGRQVEKPA